MKSAGPTSRNHASDARHDKPPTSSDRQMAIAHAKDSYTYNMRHAKDHMKAAKKAKSRLSMVRRARVRAV